MNPRILALDIETAPSIGMYFDPYKEGNIVSQVQSWYILSYSYQWLGEKAVHVRGLVDYPRYDKERTNDKLLMADLWKLLDEADIVIAHNGDKFDIKKINARFLFHGFKPPAPYKTVDTLKVARRYFKLDSNRLDAVAKYLNIGAKLPHTGINLWELCMAGDRKAWNMMKRYNKHDVVLLVAVYYALRAWMTNHPNVNVFSEEQHACPNCGGACQRRGFSPTRTGQQQRYQCKNPLCSAWSHGKTMKVVDIR